MRYLIFALTLVCLSLGLAWLVVQSSSTTNVLPETIREIRVINKHKGSQDHRGVGAPQLEEFENQIP